LDDVKWQKANGAPSFVLRTVANVAATRCSPLPDFKVESVAERVLQ
jgi:hypothetical protein